VASLSQNKKTGLYRVLFVNPADGKRCAIRLGRHGNKRWAEEVRGHVEHLVSAALKHSAPPDETSRWVAGLPGALRMRLASVGLTAAPERAVRLTLKPYLDGYMASRTDIKPSTRIALNQTAGCLVEHFGADKPLRDIKPGHADEWRRFLVGKKLAEATIRRRCGVAKAFFRAAVRNGYLPSNPFSDLKSANLANPARLFYVSRDLAKKVLDACPDAEWRLIFALCRFGGLRCPSEILRVTWADINWADGRFTVHSPKTEHHPGQDTRQVPLFPELLPYLREAFEAAEPGTEYAITRYRRLNANLHTQLRRILWRAGVDTWPRLFQNLRASCDTDLVARFPAHVCARWLGHTPQIAAKHYLQVTDADFLEAAGMVSDPGRAPHLEPDEKAARNVAQSPAPMSSQTLSPETGQEGKTAIEATRQGVAVGESNLSMELVGATGVEPVTSSL
jgi:integrase